jgi:hydroxylaminobenzene mutase
MTEAVPPSPWTRSSTGAETPVGPPPPGHPLAGQEPAQGVPRATTEPVVPQPVVVEPVVPQPVVPQPVVLQPQATRGPERPYAAQPAAEPERHPADPDETPSTKAWAVLALGVVGAALMLCGGGLVPGLAGLVLAGPARRELAASAGFLTGQRSLRAGEILCWIAVGVSAIVIVAVMIGLLIGSVGNGPSYDQNVN